MKRSNDSFKKFTDEASKKVKEQKYETTLSINSVIHAQNVLIEKKVFEMTKSTFEFNEMKNSVQAFNNTQCVHQEKAQKFELEPRYLKPSTRRSKSAAIRLTASAAWSQHLIPESIFN